MFYAAPSSQDYDMRLRMGQGASSPSQVITGV